MLFVFGKFKYMKIYAGDDRVVEKSTLCFPPEVIFGVFYFDGQLSLSLYFNIFSTADIALKQLSAQIYSLRCALLHKKERPVHHRTSLIFCRKQPYAYFIFLNNLLVFAVAIAASSSNSIPSTCAALRAVYSVYPGLLRLPRKGTGVR